VEYLLHNAEQDFKKLLGNDKNEQT